jgi:hypothetical protein
LADIPTIGKPIIDIEPDHDTEPGMTKRTIARGWGALIIFVSTAIFLLSTAVAMFGMAPMLVVSALMVPFMAIGGWLFYRGGTRRGPALRSELHTLKREHRTVSLREESSPSR